MHLPEDNNRLNLELLKTRNHLLPIKNNKQSLKNSTIKSSFSSGEIDIDKQDNISMKKLINGTNSSLPKLTKVNRTTHFLSINKKLTNDLNFQINSNYKKLFKNYFAYKQTINLQEINDYMIYEKTKKSIEQHKNNGKKNTLDFRLPIAYRRMDHHYKKEDLIPIKTKPKINLDDVLYMHNSIFRKSMSQNNCRKYYLKNSMKLIKEDTKKKNINKKPINLKMCKGTKIKSCNNNKK